MSNLVLFRRRDFIKDSSFEFQRMKAILVLIFIMCGFVYINLSAQEKYPNPQSLDSLPPDPDFYFCPHGVNAHSKKYVYDKPDDPKIRSNLQSITLDKNQSYNFELSFGEFEPCHDSYTDWRLLIKDIQKDAYGVVTFTDCAGNDTTLVIMYNPTDVAESEMREIRVLPNPANDKIHVIGLPEGTKQIKIVDVLGNEKFNY